MFYSKEQDLVNPGTIFIWHKYPNLHYEGPKDIWGLYWGKTDPFIDPVQVIFHKFTSRYDKYKTGEAREDHRIYVMKKSDYGFFEASHSVIDFTFPCMFNNEADYNSAKIVPVHQLPEDKIRYFYNQIKQSYSNIEYKIKCRIMENLNNAGITGLEKPKRNIKRPY